MSVEVTETGLNLIPAGYKQTEVGVIPEDWDIRNIGDFAPLQRGFDLPSANRVNGKYPVVYSNGIVNTHCHFKVKGPGVVTGRSGTLGKVHYVEADYWPHNTSLWVTKFNETNPKFIYFTTVLTLNMDRLL
ncbi:Type I restriction modification DNA specificity domain [Proteus mirabilis]|uniref:Type I restriction modification DNA specificity domain n=1 Tax=Proteus mirabilis TaxID=584 RepID=A0A2X2BKE4_PROMI|nr:Type I restriction modification DNA specificity domain [Proteus mirabilis]